MHSAEEEGVSVAIQGDVVLIMLIEFICANSYANDMRAEIRMLSVFRYSF